MDNRIIFRILPSKRIKGWWDITVSNSESGYIIKFKKDALNMGRLLANQKYAEGMNAQLVVHNSKGVITGEHTYGDDPRRSKG